MPGPNGEPSGMSAGAWAVTRASQHGHVTRNRLIRVDRLDLRQIDMVPRPREFLTCLWESGAARAALGVDVACRVRVLCERSRRARMAFACFLHPRRLPDVPLLSARRRQ